MSRARIQPASAEPSRRSPDRFAEGQEQKQTRRESSFEPVHCPAPRWCRLAVAVVQLRSPPMELRPIVQLAGAWVRRYGHGRFPRLPYLSAHSALSPGCSLWPFFQPARMMSTLIRIRIQVYRYREAHDDYWCATLCEAYVYIVRLMSKLAKMMIIVNHNKAWIPVLQCSDVTLAANTPSQSCPISAISRRRRGRQRFGSKSWDISFYLVELVSYGAWTAANGFVWKELSLLDRKLAGQSIILPISIAPYTIALSGSNRGRCPCAMRAMRFSKCSGNNQRLPPAIPNLLLFPNSRILHRDHR
jgi:hypothetical protein